MQMYPRYQWFETSFVPQVGIPLCRAMPYSSACLIATSCVKSTAVNESEYRWKWHTVLWEILKNRKCSVKGSEVTREGTKKVGLGYLLYKDESVYVCMCVCPAACSLTHTTNHPKIWHGLLISSWLGTEQGGDRKCWPLGVPPTVTPSEKLRRVNNWAGASKQKLLLGMGLPSKILFVGGSPKPGALRVHPTKWGCMLWELGGGQQTKVVPRGGFAM